ncbi:MAG TPA: YHYH protein [Candidatus Eisenbacteria bacterium]|nr:YHYH protein [Candidatus Eisenbacteria bacterium]
MTTAFRASIVTVIAAASFALAAHGATVTAGSLIRASGPAVYYYGSDGKRYVFPNEATYKTWYADFSTVKTIADADLAAIGIGGNVTYRPGVRLVKITTDPKVYAVAADGTLRHLASESVAAALYGSAWATGVDDVPDAFFVNYHGGAVINVAADYDPAAARVAAPTISADVGLSPDWGGVDPTKLPLGDQKHSATPTKGSIYSCQTNFGGGGAFADGPWIQGSTWDMTGKVTVSGSVVWPNAAFAMTASGSNRVFTSNGFPVNHPTGVYPIASSDDAYQYDRNPNSIQTQSLSITLPLLPSLAASPSCVGGEVGIAVTGIPIFNGFDAGGRDAAAHEIQDGCGGHPQVSGLYHYHGGSGCVATGDSELFGFAFDGFGIFSNLEDGKSLTNADLDDCHGHVHEVAWNGGRRNMYHYHLTKEFPYTVGCFRGTKYVNGPLGGVEGMGPPR